MSITSAIIVFASFFVSVAQATSRLLQGHTGGGGSTTAGILGLQRGIVVGQTIVTADEHDEVRDGPNVPLLQAGLGEMDDTAGGIFGLQRGFFVGKKHRYLDEDAHVGGGASASLLQMGTDNTEATAGGILGLQRGVTLGNTMIVSHADGQAQYAERSRDSPLLVIGGSSLLQMSLGETEATAGGILGLQRGIAVGKTIITSHEDDQPQHSMQSHDSPTLVTGGSSLFQMGLGETEATADAILGLQRGIAVGKTNTTSHGADEDQHSRQSLDSPRVMAGGSSLLQRGLAETETIAGGILLRGTAVGNTIITSHEAPSLFQVKMEPRAKEHSVVSGVSVSGLKRGPLVKKRVASNGSMSLGLQRRVIVSKVVVDDEDAGDALEHKSGGIS